MAKLFPWLRLVVSALIVLFASAIVGNAEAAEGDTIVCKWKDDMTGVFLLMFDDGHHSQVSQVIPNLHARDMTATFYVPTDWITDSFLGDSAVILGNHSKNHQQMSAPTYEAAKTEQIDPSQEFFRNNAAGNWPRLISFARPGFGPEENWWLEFAGGWEENATDFIRLMDENNLIKRPPFGSARAGGSPASAQYGYITTANSALAVADLAINDKKMEYIIFHNIEIPSVPPSTLYGFTFVNSEFIAFLNGLKTRMDNKQLWITDHISYHQYEKQRESAVVTTLEYSDTRIRLTVTDGVDDILYNQPLTMKTEVPSGWTTVVVTQNNITTERPVVNGIVRYDVKSNGAEVTLSNPAGGATLGTPATAVLTITNDDVSNATTKYWDGAGTWTDANSWSLSSGGPYNKSWASGDTAVFDVAGSTITGADVTVSSITANEGVTFTAGGTLSTGGGVATITVKKVWPPLVFGSQAIASDAGFIKDGPGTWSLNGGNYTGNFTINAGTVAMQNVNALGGTKTTRTLTLNGGQIRSSGVVDRDLGTRGGPWMPTPAIGSTRSGNVVYLHLLREDDGVVELPALPKPVKQAALLGGGKVNFSHGDGKLRLDFDNAAIDPIDTIIRLELDGSAMDIPAISLGSYLKATAPRTSMTRRTAPMVP